MSCATARSASARIATPAHSSSPGEIAHERSVELGPEGARRAARARSRWALLAPVTRVGAQDPRAATVQNVRRATG